MGNKARFVWAGIAALVVALFLLRSIPLTERPMFCNYYGPHGDRGLMSEIVPYWHEELLVLDDQRNFAISDHRLNLMVIVVTHDPKLEAVSGPILESTPSEAWLLKSTPYAVRMPRQEDVLVVVLPDRTETFDLLPGEAERLWNGMFPAPSSVFSHLIESGRFGKDARQRLKRIAVETEKEVARD